MAKSKINFDREIYEGWRVKDFIEELTPIMDMIQAGKSWMKPMSTKAEIKKYTADNQSYYKKAIPEVVAYFCDRYGI